MADIFLQKDLVNLLRNKRIVLMGDSNVRAVYKDVLCLSKQSKFCSDRIFKTKMENSVFGDKLVYHGLRSNGRDYQEEREAISSGVDVSFYFLTRVYSDYVKKILKNISKKCPPDILVIGSCVWDVTRWGPYGVQDYKSNLKTLLKQIQTYFPKTLFIWLTAPPIAVDMKGG
ncbi:Protein FAM113B, partial [Stegodyphus mimosarum]